MSIPARKEAREEKDLLSGESVSVDLAAAQLTAWKPLENASDSLKDKRRKW